MDQPNATTISRTGPARRWLEALPLGNGHLGAMVWGDPDSARFSMNVSTLWSGTPASARRDLTGPDDARDALSRAKDHLLEGKGGEADLALAELGATWCQAYQPLGQLEVRRRRGDAARSEDATVLEGDDPRVAVRTLDMLGHEHTVESAGGQHRTIVSAVDDVLVHGLPLAEGDEIEVDFSSELVVESRSAAEGALDLVVRAPSDCPPSHAPGSPPVRWEEDGAARASVSVRWRSEGGRAVVVLAAVTSWRWFGQTPDRDLAEIRDASRRTAERALQQDEDALRERHRRAVGPVAHAVSLTLEGSSRGALLAQLFAYGRYLLQASTRIGLPPANLQGIWNAQLRAPWSSNFTTNINLEMAHWAAGVAAVPEAADALDSYLDVLRAAGRDTARRLYGARGWAAHHNSDPWGYTDPVDGPAVWATWPMAGLWLETDLADLRRFEGHCVEGLAQRDFSRLREVSAFALDLLHPAPGSDMLVTFPSTSPENRYLDDHGAQAAASFGTGMDRWLVRRAFTGLLRAADQLGRSSDPVVQEASRALDRIAGPRVGPDGRILEWHEDVPETEPHHRHISHLAFAYPGSEKVDDELALAIRRSLDARSDDASGWSLVWKICQWARLHEPARVEKLLDLCLREAEASDGSEHSGLYPNLFSAHPPFQIDGNIGTVSAIAECLVQSHRGEIEILPAVPRSMATGSARGLRARPGVAVDISWADARPNRVRLTALGPGSEGTTVLRWGPSAVEVDLTEGSPVDIDIAALASQTAVTARSRA